MRKLTINKPLEDVFVTSDTHFGHRKLSALRGFGSVDEHDEALISTWNSLVDLHAIVIVFGDVSFQNKARSQEIMQILNGHKYVIPGNHDSSKNLEAMFGEENILSQLLRIKVIDPYDDTDRFEFVASHYPLASWEGSDHGSLQLHGHLHSKNNEVSHHFCSPYVGRGVRFDVGIDNAEWFGHPLSPIPLTTVMQRFNQAIAAKAE